jgi:hypothetical protein
MMQKLGTLFDKYVCLIVIGTIVVVVAIENLSVL